MDVRGELTDWSFRELLSQIRREARRLDEAGLGRGSVVAVMTGNGVRAFVLRWATNVVGAAVTLIADGYSAEAVAEILDTVDADALITDAARAKLGQAAADRAGGVDVIDLDVAEPPADTSALAVRIRPEDLASISLTGGSTGTPKGVPRYARVPQIR